jgi:hypothetical protein
MWEKLPKELSRLILEKHLQNCHKQKAIKLLVKHVFNNIQDHKDDKKISFSINTIKAPYYWNNIECLFQFNCIYIIEKHRKQSDIVLAEYNTKEFVFGLYSEQNITKANKILIELIIKLFDSAIENKSDKPTCYMHLDVLTPLSLPFCDDLYTI